MLPLDSPRWSELSHAYGDASDLPELLRELESLPPDIEREAEPYFTMWSSLCHQGDVYDGSYAAVPHIVRIMETAPERVPWTLFLMIACIEIARAKGNGPVIAGDLQKEYSAALGKIPMLAEAASHKDWDHTYCGSVLAAIAASKGLPQYAEAILELDADTVTDFLEKKYGE